MVNKIGFGALIAVVVGLIVLFNVGAETVDNFETLNDSNQCSNVDCVWNTSNAVCYATSNFSAATCSAAGQSIPLGNAAGSIVPIILAALFIGLAFVGLKRL